MIKGLLKKDLYNLSTYKVSLIIIILFCGIAIIGTNAINIAPAIICGIVGMISLSTFSYDEISKANRYVLTLPASRKELVREKYYPVMNYEKMSSELSNTFGVKNSDFYYDESHLSNESITRHLQSNRPIIVCVWNNEKNNRWTTASHYMVLLATDNDNMVYVSNPNGLENDSKSSGWYDINEITPYIAKALYIEDYK